MDYRSYSLYLQTFIKENKPLLQESWENVLTDRPLDSGGKPSGLSGPEKISLIASHLDDLEEFLHRQSDPDPSAVPLSSCPLLQEAKILLRGEEMLAHAVMEDPRRPQQLDPLILRQFINRTFTALLRERLAL